MKRKSTKIYFLIGLVILIIDFVLYAIWYEQLNSFFLLTGVIPATLCWAYGFRKSKVDL